MTIRYFLWATCALSLFITGSCKPADVHDHSSASKEGATGSRNHHPPSADTAPAIGPAFDDMAFVRGGSFLMGTEDGFIFEGPVHEIAIRSFWMDRREVTVAKFAEFVRATGHITEAERFGWSGVFDVESGEWKNVDSASWRYPEGQGADASLDEPVTQVSWNDAAAYARWAGKRLPTEAEWEYAARGGLEGNKYSWGDKFPHKKEKAANCWQGTFPKNNTCEDGYMRRAPVGRFRPNGYGLYDMAGNVWEWCADWFDEGYYVRSERDNPGGPASGTRRVLRGGSWMCSGNFCQGYRVAARSHSPPDSGLNNLGFRCVRDGS